MIDLIRIFSMDTCFDIIHAVIREPKKNASYLARKLSIHIITVQKVLDTLERYGFVKIEEKRGVGRPSKTYEYLGGSFTLDIDNLLREYSKKSVSIRETGDPHISFSYDIDKEIVNAVLFGGKNGEKMKLEERSGRFLWLAPPPDSEGAEIETIARQAGIPILDAVRLSAELVKLNVLEEID